MTLQLEDYRALARFRFLIRRFLQFSESAAQEAGLEPQQHQLMLMIRACDEAGGPTIGMAAERLLIRHHSAVGLVDRLEEHGLVERAREGADRREVRLRLTARGEHTLAHLSQSHQSELRKMAPQLVEALSGLLEEWAAR
ncbi:MAG TPA: MarR family transcriptional regulator [Candidatus Acidoferrales bacterium]|nr:MarR family transcriptional regulator [Candidatus Acidoferrales bacterium]